MLRITCLRLSAVIVLIICLCSPSLGGPKGAKAIFDSGEGPQVGVSVGGAPKPAAPVAETEKKDKYVGISYQLMLVSDDGQFKTVSKNRVFKSGERIKILVRTNKPGYMTIVNIGPTGNSHVLFNDYVDAYQVHEIPKGTNLRFVGDPGTEKLLIMLSDQPNPIGGQQPNAVVASLEGAKSVKGSKDIVAEDSMKSNYAVVSPKDDWKPSGGGAKDIVLESTGGVNYGVVPASAVAGGGILTVEVKLQHK